MRPVGTLSRTQVVTRRGASVSYTHLLTILDDERTDGVLIAGDVYDKPVPPTEAVELLDGFLTELCARGVPVLLISGNHDSRCV